MKRHDSRQRRGGIPQGSHNVPIIGEKRRGAVEEKITFQLAKFQFHPPVGFDQVYAMMVMMLASGIPSVYKVVNAFGGQFQLYLAEDCELGKKHDIVVVCCDAEGQLGFMVAKPVEDDPAAEKPKH